MNTNHIGDVSEMEVRRNLIRAGAKVSIPVHDSLDYDLLADVDNTIYRVQVKTARWRNEPRTISVDVSPKRGGERGHYTDDAFDILAAYWPEGDRVIYASWDDIGYRKFNCTVVPTKQPHANKIDEYSLLNAVDNCNK